MNEPVIFDHFVDLKREHQLHARLKICSDRDDYCAFKASGIPLMGNIQFPKIVLNCYKDYSPKIILQTQQNVGSRAVPMITKFPGLL